MKRILIASLVAALLGGAYAWREYNRGHVSMTETKADLTATASELYAAFSTDEAAANAKYLGKTIEISGKVSATSTEEGTTTITLFADSETGGVTCKLDPLSKHERTSFQEGEQITVKGICTGYLMDVVVERAVVK
jgi:23S rRNA maturation-related 3'-5' exoribonuclease YhaM